MKHLICLVFLITGALIFGQRGKVVRIKDGDTIVVLDENKVEYTVRVADIDCPEYKQPYSDVAKQFVADEVFLENVAIVSKGLDRYGRTIGFVIYGEGKDLSRELLIHGLAWHYVKYSDSPTFGFLESMSKEDNRGLWADTNPVPPWEWRSLKKN